MELNELTDEAIDHILFTIELASLSEWEIDFIESVANQWERSRFLSEKQKLKLGQIWDKQPSSKIESFRA
jgi:hypothetical protein